MEEVKKLIILLNLIFFSSFKHVSTHKKGLKRERTIERLKISEIISLQGKLFMAENDHFVIC